MKAFAQEPGDPQTSLPSTTRRLATLYYKLQSTFRAASGAEARRARAPGSIDQSPIDHGGWWICGGLWIR